MNASPPKPRLRPSVMVLALEIVAGLLLMLFPARTFRSDNFVFYSSTERRLVPYDVVDNTIYLPLLGVLNAAGKINGWQEKTRSLSVWFGGVELQLKPDDRKVKLNKAARNLSHPVRMTNGQWMVPVDFLSSVLQELIHQPVHYQVEGRRVFIGDVNPLTYTARLDPLADGARLTVQFSGPVTVRTASRNGVWVLYLGNAAVQPSNAAARFQNPYLGELRFDDQDGAPKLILTPGVEGLNFYPSQAASTTFVADVRKPAAVAQEPPRRAEPAVQAPPAAALPQAPALPAVVLDAGHGGPDTGARSRDGVLEKELVAALKERVRLGLLATKKYRVVETRAGDSDPDFDQRAATSNGARPVVFLSFHAGNLGNTVPRVAVYTYLPLSHNIALAGVPSQDAPAAPRRAGAQPGLPPWTEIQQDQLPRSRLLAQALAAQLAAVPGVTASAPVEAPVRILRSVDAPAVAIELGSVASDVDAQPLTSAGLQQQLANAVVHAIDIFLGG